MGVMACSFGLPSVLHSENMGSSNLSLSDRHTAALVQYSRTWGLAFWCMHGVQSIDCFNQPQREMQTSSLNHCFFIYGTTVSHKLWDCRLKDALMVGATTTKKSNSFLILIQQILYAFCTIKVLTSFLMNLLSTSQIKFIEQLIKIMSIHKEDN